LSSSLPMETTPPHKPVLPTTHLSLLTLPRQRAPLPQGQQLRKQGTLITTQVGSKEARLGGTDDFNRTPNLVA
ncbi:hypothetical protein BaRGS_00000654, partial [Batillaria attramentaria]